jgi:hypothetical protein
MRDDSEEPLDVEAAITHLVYLADLRQDLGQVIEEPDEGRAPWAEDYDPDLEETYRELLRPVLNLGGDTERAALKDSLKSRHHEERHPRAAIEAAGSPPAVLSDRDARELEAVFREHGAPLRDALEQRKSVIARANIVAYTLAARLQRLARRSQTTARHASWDTGSDSRAGGAASP